MTDLRSDDRQRDDDAPAPEASRTIELPARLADRVERRVAVTDFDSTADYVSFVLEETLARVDDADEGGDPEPDADVSQEEVESRLESLGYLE